jgi:hypothetical protein
MALTRQETDAFNGSQEVAAIELADVDHVPRVEADHELSAAVARRLPARRSEISRAFEVTDVKFHEPLPRWPCDTPDE